MDQRESATDQVEAKDKGFSRDSGEEVVMAATGGISTRRPKSKPKPKPKLQDDQSPPNPGSQQCTSEHEPESEAIMTDDKAQETEEEAWNRRTSQRARAKGASRDDESSTSRGARDEKQEKRAEARHDFDAALAKIKAGRGTRRRQAKSSSSANEGESIDVQYDDLAIDLHRRMLRAAEMDCEAIRQGRPALRKLEMLPEVRRLLNRSDLTDFLLDNRILEAMRIWMEPLPNGTLPAVDLRLALLEELQRLPIDTQLLRESRIGRIVMFFYSRSGEFSPIQRIAGELVQTWSRPIIGKAADFRRLSMQDQRSGPSHEQAVMQSERLKERGGGVDYGPAPYAKLTRHFKRK